MKIRRVAETAEFDSIVGELKGHPKLYVVLIGSEEEATGESWCIDCVIADPIIRRSIGKIEDSILVECPVGLRAEYKNKPNHPYRVHPEIKLTSVPTLIHWTPTGPGRRLVEAECQDQRLVDEFVFATTATATKRGVYAREAAVEAVQAKTLFVGGCTGTGGDIAEQTRQALDSLKDKLAAGGCGFKDVVKTVVMMTDMGTYAAINKVYSEAFTGEAPPARSAFAVAALPDGASVMIEAVAAVPDRADADGVERPAKIQKTA